MRNVPAKEEGGFLPTEPPPPLDAPMALLLCFYKETAIDSQQFNHKMSYNIRMKYLMGFYINWTIHIIDSLAHNLFRHFHSLYWTCTILTYTIPTHYEYQEIVTLDMLHSNRKSKVKYTLKISKFDLELCKYPWPLKQYTIESFRRKFNTAIANRVL